MQRDEVYITPKPLTESAMQQARELIDTNFDRAQELMHFMAKHWIENTKDVRPESSPTAIVIFNVMQPIKDHPDEDVEAFESDVRTYIGGDPVFGEASIEDTYKDSKMMWILREARRNGIENLHALRMLAMTADKLEK